MNKSKQKWWLIGFILILGILGVASSNVYLQNKRRMQVSITPTSISINDESKDIAKETKLTVSSKPQITVKPAAGVASTMQKPSFCDNCKLDFPNNTSQDCIVCAYHTNDQTKCNFLPAGRDKDACILGYHALKGDLKSYCNTLVIPLERDKCFGSLANINQDVSYCALIQNTNININCYSYIANNKNDINICQQCTKSPVSCVAEYAGGKRDMNLCEVSFLDSNQETSCKLMTVGFMKQPALCNTFPSDQDIAACYFFAVTENKESAMCDSAKRIIKDQCYAFYGWDIDKNYRICLQKYNSITSSPDQAMCLGYYGSFSKLGSQICAYYQPTGIADVDSKGASLCTDIANK